MLNCRNNILYIKLNEMKEFLSHRCTYLPTGINQLGCLLFIKKDDNQWPTERERGLTVLLPTTCQNNILRIPMTGARKRSLKLLPGFSRNNNRKQTPTTLWQDVITVGQTVVHADGVALEAWRIAG